jgi:predicted regulator of Ras-like GTPase activity (Roadblock/LC7/MglB family)
MPPLHDVLATLAGRPDASGALVVSDEGLVIDAVLPAGIEAEAVAAHAATAFRSLQGLATALHHGTPQQAAIDSEHGVVILTLLTAGSALVVLGRPGAEMGELLYDLRRHGPAVAELV